MAEPFVGEIRAFGFNFAPVGWAMCQGQLMQISQYSTLFALIGTTYGGDGRTTFGLPDLRGRAAIGQGMGPGLSPYHMGDRGGAEIVTLNTNQMPQHSHQMTDKSTQAALTCTAQEANATTPVNNSIAANVRGETLNRFSDQNPSETMKPGSIALSGNTEPTGGNQPHENRAPYLVINYCIAFQGIWPSRP